MWGNNVIYYFIVLFTNNFIFWENVGKQGGLLWCVSIYKRISFWFSSMSTLLFGQYYTSVLSESSLKKVLPFFFQSIQLNLAGPVCPASHQNLTKFWLALPMYAWGLVFVKLECDHQPTADFLWLPQIYWDSGEITFLVAPFPPTLFKVFP